MYVTKSINANHEDLIHDVAYDFYGKRMATCSSDQKVKVWDQQENGEWVCSARFPIHFSNKIYTCKVNHMKSIARGSNNFPPLSGASQYFFHYSSIEQALLDTHTHILQLEVSLWLCVEGELGPSGVWTGTEGRGGLLRGLKLSG